MTAAIAGASIAVTSPKRSTDSGPHAQEQKEALADQLERRRRRYDEEFYGAAGGNRY